MDYIWNAELSHWNIGHTVRLPGQTSPTMFTHMRSRFAQHVVKKERGSTTDDIPLLEAWENFLYTLEEKNEIDFIHTYALYCAFDQVQFERSIAFARRAQNHQRIAIREKRRKQRHKKRVSK